MFSGGYNTSNTCDDFQTINISFKKEFKGTITIKTEDDNPPQITASLHPSVEAEITKINYENETEKTKAVDTYINKTVLTSSNLFCSPKREDNLSDRFRGLSSSSIKPGECLGTGIIDDEKNKFPTTHYYH